MVASRKHSQSSLLLYCSLFYIEAIDLFEDKPEIGP